MLFILANYVSLQIDSLFVYPMSFDEFLDATGNSSLVRVKKKASAEHPLMDAFYNKLVEAFRSFILVGGMPEAVSIFAATGSYRKSGAVVSSIIQGYQDDFSKYAKKVAQFNSSVFGAWLRQPEYGA